MKTILVSGATGFIGKAVIQSLLKTEFEIHAVTSGEIPMEPSGVTWHRANLLDRDHVSRLFTSIKPQYLIQLAWCTGQSTYWRDIANLEWVNANLFIARQFQVNGGIRCLFAGTSAEYDWTGNKPLNESVTGLKPLLLYGGSKLAVYWALTRFFEQEKVSFVWARFFNPFGEGEDQRRLIPKTCLGLLRGNKLTFDAGMSLRDFLHVKDVGGAVVSALQSEVEGPLNIGSGYGISVRTVITQIATNYKLNDLVEFSSAGDGRELSDSIVADTNKLNQICGWTTSISFEERLSETCKWWEIQYKKQP